VSTINADPRGEFLQFPVPNTVTSNQPLLVGQLAVVAQESYTPPGGLTPTGNVSCALIGAFFLTVTAKTSLSPSTNSAVNPGDKIYADGGSLDSTTNVTSGFTLDKNSGGTYFGNALDKLATGTTGTIRVRLKVTG
jgi:hypothetical protein